MPSLYRMMRKVASNIRGQFSKEYAKLDLMMLCNVTLGHWKPAGFLLDSCDTQTKMITRAVPIKQPGIIKFSQSQWTICLPLSFAELLSYFKNWPVCVSVSVCTRTRASVCVMAERGGGTVITSEYSQT